jgi:hypothetical protein
MILRQEDDFGNWNKKHYIALCVELVLEDIS